jgi:hypothetical protein
MNTIMETVTITPNLKLTRLWNGILGSIGFLVTAQIIYGYMIGDTPDNWFLYLPVGVWVMINGLGQAFGYYELSFPQISLDESKLSVSSHVGGEIDLDNLSWVKLKNSRIEFEFRSTGNRDYFRIPWRFRIKSRLETLRKALQERCRHQGIEFESEF